MNVKGRIAIITGAGSGIGKELAFELASHGCTPVLVDISEDRLPQALETVQQYAPLSTSEACDVSDTQQVKRMVQNVYERYERIDILINNAGIMTVKLFNDLSGNGFDRQMAVNFSGPLILTRAVLPIMDNQRSGVILNIASLVYKLNAAGTTAYTASKAALYAFSEALYYEVKDKGIHVGVVLPGGISTGLLDNVANKLGEYQRDHCQTLPSQITSQIREAIEKERFETVVPSRYRFYLMFHGVFPGLFRKFALNRLRPYLN